MDQLTQADIIDMYRSQVANMEGGRRRRVGRPRKRRGRGLVGGVADASANVEGYISGMGLVGGRRRVGRPRGSTRPKMTAKVMEFFASKKRGKRGRGLVGGKSNQDIYDELVDQGQAITPEMLNLMKAGIQPATQKETLIRRIRALEKRIGVGQSSTEKLNKYSVKALEGILKIYNDHKFLLAYPPVSKAADQFDDNRFEPYAYEGLIKAKGNEGYAAELEKLSQAQAQQFADIFA
jgi:hypothetical protein